MKEKILQICKGVNPAIEDGIDLTDVIDSFSVVNIIVELESEFDIEIDPDDVVAENFRDIAAIVALVEKNRKASE